MNIFSSGIKNFKDDGQKCPWNFLHIRIRLRDNNYIMWYIYLKSQLCIMYRFYNLWQHDCNSNSNLKSCPEVNEWWRNRTETEGKCYPADPMSKTTQRGLRIQRVGRVLFFLYSPRNHRSLNTGPNWL